MMAPLEKGEDFDDCIKCGQGYGPASKHGGKRPRRPERRRGRELADRWLPGFFGGNGHRSGFSAKELKLASARPNLNWSYMDGALLELEDRCFYLHSTAAGSLGKRYWFGTKPTLNKLIVQYRQQVSRDTFDEDILTALRSQGQKSTAGGATWRVLVDPEADLPEQKSLTLLVLPPSLAWGDDDASRDTVRKRVQALSSRCGGKERLYRNTLVFLVPAARSLAKLRQAYRERAALAGVRNDYGEQLDQAQADDLKKRIEAAEKAALEALGPAYTVGLRLDGQDVDVVSLNDARSAFGDHLGYVWSVLVEDEEWILKRVGSVTLQKTGLLPEEGGLRVKDAIEAFLRFTDKPMVAAKEAVTAGLAQACADGLIGIGRGATAKNLQTRYCRQMVEIDGSEDGVWIIPAFESTKPEPASKDGSAKGEPEPSGDKTGTSGTTAQPTGDGTKSGEKERTVRRLLIRGKVPQESWADVFRSFVGPAARMHLKKLDLGIEFEMELGSEPLNDATLKNMREAAKQLGLEFEEKE